MITSVCRSFCYTNDTAMFNRSCLREPTARFGRSVGSAAKPPTVSPSKPHTLAAPLSALLQAPLTGRLTTGRATDAHAEHYVHGGWAPPPDHTVSRVRTAALTPRRLA